MEEKILKMLEKMMMKVAKIAIEKAISLRRQERRTEDDVWLAPEQLLAQFGQFSPDWMKRNAWRLPRKRCEVKDESGNIIATRYAYNQREIAEMLK